VLQNPPQTRASIGCVMRAYAPRALLQIFITNTFNHRFAGVVFSHGYLPD
jgi:hypothetical protein